MSEGQPYAQVGLDTPLGGSGKIKLTPVSGGDGSVVGSIPGGGGVSTKKTSRGGGGGGGGKGSVSINGGISDEISAQLEHITSGDQVVEFYARHGQASGVKFFYCNQQPPGQLHYRPYELVVCDRLDVIPDSYFTISAGGVVNVCKGKETEFTPLGKAAASITPGGRRSSYMGHTGLSSIRVVEHAPPY